MAVPLLVEELDELELRTRLDEAIADALELADRMAESIAQTRFGDSERARLAANYLQLRTQIRGLKRLLVAAVAG